MQLMATLRLITLPPLSHRADNLAVLPSLPPPTSVLSVSALRVLAYLCVSVSLLGTATAVLDVQMTT